ncbi:MAG TPA: DNA polymerase III subunit delta [Patescibacteria group bacterium]|nr:DNA polymerase III subunit delta [Patescibacteria group bacterium]
MIILVTGTDTFRSKEKVEELHQAFQKKFDPSGFNFSSFPENSGKIPTPADVFQQACSAPFLAERRMVVIHNLLEEKKKNTEKSWIEVCARVPASTILLFWEDTGVGELAKKSFFVQITSLPETIAYDFPLLQGRELERWIATRIRTLNATAEPNAIRALADRVGSDLWRMDGELKKLTAYVPGLPLTKSNVEELVISQFPSRVFDFMDAVATRRGSLAVQLLEKERLAGTADGMIFHLLVRHVRLLLGASAFRGELPRVEAGEAAKMLNVHPFAMRKAFSQARSFPLQTLFEIHRLFCRLDAGVKTGKYTERTAVELAVISLLTSPMNL